MFTSSDWCKPANVIVPDLFHIGPGSLRECHLRSLGTEVQSFHNGIYDINNGRKQLKKEIGANSWKKNVRTKLRCSMFSAGFRGRGGSRTAQEGPYMPGGRFWNQAINLKKSQKIDILKNRYNSSFAWSYGSGVGSVKIPVKNSINSWGQILKNRCFGPVTSKWPIVSI